VGVGQLLAVRDVIAGHGEGRDLGQEFVRQRWPACHGNLLDRFDDYV
jgi:hypothetical protein